MIKLLLTSVVAIASLGACRDGADADATRSHASSSSEAAHSAAPATVSASATASSRAQDGADTPTKTAAAKPSVEVPTIDDKLPTEKEDLAAFAKAIKTSKAKMVGKKYKLEGEIHSVSYNAMVFDADHHGLHGPEVEGTPGGVYGVEVHGKKKSEDSVVCYVDHASAKELVSLVGTTNHIVVEGIVEPTFGSLAPCRVVSANKVGK